VKIFFIAIVILLNGCSEVAPKPKTTPAWYLDQISHKNSVTGYGQGASCDAAKTEARNDIAKQLLVTLESDLQITQDSDAFYYSKSHIKESVNTLTLNGIKLKFKPETIGDTCYIAMEYSLNPLIFKASLAAQNTNTKVMAENSLLAHTIFAQKLHAKLGYIPEFTLSFDTGQPILHIAYESIPLSKKDMRTMVFEKYSDAIAIKVSPERTLHVGERYEIELSVHRSNYLSLIYVDEFYNAQIAIKNRFISKPEEQFFPKGESLMAGIASNTKNIKEIYIALLCDKPLNLSPFAVLDRSEDVDKDALKISELLVLANSCESASRILSIQK